MWKKRRCRSRSWKLEETWGAKCPPTMALHPEASTSELFVLSLLFVMIAIEYAYLQYLN